VGVGHNEPEIDELIGLKHNFGGPQQFLQAKTHYSIYLKLQKTVLPSPPKNGTICCYGRIDTFDMPSVPILYPVLAKVFCFFLRTKIYK